MVDAHHAIECIAIVGKQNNPIFLKNFTEKPDLDLHFFVYASLDAVEERLNETQKTAELYLGKIFSMDNLNVYGLCAATRVKFLCVVRWTGRPPKDEPVQKFLTEIHKNYVKLVSNPFYVTDTAIRGDQCSGFMKQIEQIKF